MNLSMLLSSLLADMLIDSLWLTALIALACGLAFELLRNARPATRHVVGMLALLAMAGAPIALALWGLATAGRVTGFLAPMAAANVVENVPAFGAAAQHNGFVVEQMHEWMSVCLAQCWLFGVMLMLVLQLRVWWQVRRLRSTSLGVVPAHWQQRFDVLRRQLGIAREVVLRAHDGMGSPFTAFAWRPMVWLPLAWLAQLPADQIEMLLAHELAHIKRLDWIWNALQCLIEALLFFHPAMWWISARVRHERELACDELAVSAGGDAIALAQALHAVQGSVSFTPRVVLNAEGGMLVKRIRYLLSGSPIRNRWPVLGGLALLLCSGSLVALELKPPHHVVINMMTTGNDGELTAPGDYRDVKVDLLSGKTVVYHASMDKAGHVLESFTEDGKPAKLEDDTRDWLRSLATQAAKPVQPAPPPLPPAPPALAAPASPPALATPAAPAAPPALAAPAPPAAPPAPPAPYKLIDSAAFQAMQADVAMSSTAQAIAGQPMHLVEDSVHGEIHQWSAWDFHLYGIEPSPGGRAQLHAVFEGPKGRVRVAYVGEVRDGIWSAKQLNASPVAG